MKQDNVKIIAIDPEPEVLNQIAMYVAEIEEAEFLEGFSNSIHALQFLKEHRVDLVFLAMVMEPMQGIQTAERIAEVKDAPVVAYVTWKKEYSYEAWKTHAVAYILKPFQKEDLECAVKRARYYKRIKLAEQIGNVAGDETTDNQKPEVFIKCFPAFDIYVNGEIIKFSSNKVKELLAFLVFRQGNWVEIDQIVFYILESHEERKGKQYYRTLMFRLKKVLEEYNIDNMLENGYGRARINPEYFTCEYYQYLNGSNEMFQGAFMGSYSWSEEAKAYMTRNIPGGIF